MGRRLGGVGGGLFVWAAVVRSGVGPVVAPSTAIRGPGPSYARRAVLRTAVVRAGRGCQAERALERTNRLTSLRCSALPGLVVRRGAPAITFGQPGPHPRLLGLHVTGDVASPGAGARRDAGRAVGTPTVRVGHQNTTSEYGAMSQPKACDADPTAPGTCSTTRPARCSAWSDPPPSHTDARS